MKIIGIIIITLSIQISAFAQTVKVEGIAIDSYKRGRIQIMVNDTVSKVPRHLFDSLILKIGNNKDLVTYSNFDGAFSINAKLSDSLHFSKHFFKTEIYKVEDLIKTDNIKIELKELPCKEYVPCNESATDLRIFIGKKIAINYGDYQHYCGIFSVGDSKYKSKYQILKSYYGEIPTDTVEFISYIHSAKVKFFEYENILIYVEKYCGENIQRKYTFYPVYRTKKGKWVVPVMKEFDTSQKISAKKPHKVRMAEPIVVPKYYRNRDYKEVYPEPYYKIKNGKVFLSLAYDPEDIIAN